jgi:hypothetical protein
MEGIMVGYVILAFFIGGFLGILGMAAMACGPKQKLTRDIHIMTRRLDFLEREGEKKRYKPVTDPRPRVHKLVN